MSAQPHLFCAPVAGLVPVGKDVANQLLVDWGHDLGPCERPFGVEGWTLDVGLEPVSVAVSASTVSKTVHQPWGLHRYNCVELARQCSHPDQRWATRPMLRLWREVAAPRWPHWPVEAVVSYSTRRHEGDMYRWDGWTLLDIRRGSGGGGQWSSARTDSHPAAGDKKLWGYRLAGAA